jgi:hypothetical protein
MTKNAPLNGAMAFMRGFSCDACPFRAEDYRFEEWQKAYANRAAIAARDAALAQKPVKPRAPAPSPGGNIFKPKYGQRYAAEGHPRNCGDELARALDRICHRPDETFDVELFEAIVELNGRSVAHLSHTNHGWEGRLRATGRNMLAKVARLNEGRLAMPPGVRGPLLLSPAWLARPVKPKGQKNG